MQLTQVRKPEGMEPLHSELRDMLSHSAIPMMDVWEQFCLFSLRERILNSNAMKAHIVQ